MGQTRESIEYEIVMRRLHRVWIETLTNPSRGFRSHVGRRALTVGITTEETYLSTTGDLNPAELGEPAK